MVVVCHNLLFCFYSPISNEINPFFIETCKNTLQPYFQKYLVKFLFTLNNEAK